MLRWIAARFNTLTSSHSLRGRRRSHTYTLRHVLARPPGFSHAFLAQLTKATIGQQVVTAGRGTTDPNSAYSLYSVQHQDNGGPISRGVRVKTTLTGSYAAAEKHIWFGCLLRESRPMRDVCGMGDRQKRKGQGLGARTWAMSIGGLPF